MARITRKPGNPHRSAVKLAIAAVEGRPNPLDDPEMESVDPDPASLDLPDGRPVDGVRLSSRRSHPPVDVCPTCGLRMATGCNVL